MHRFLSCFFTALLAGTFYASPEISGAPANSILTAVEKESVLLFKTSISEKEKLPETELSIPWDKPSFQFWLSYYKNRWNRMKLVSLIDNFRVFYPAIK
jgi:membrane-bound lytic murein transglycosylase D